MLGFSPMGFLLDEARTSVLVTAGVCPAAGLAYLKSLGDGVNIAEMVKAKRSVTSTGSVLFGFMYQALKTIKLS